MISEELCVRSLSSYLRNNFELGAHGDGTESVPNGVANVVMGPETEGESEKWEHMLERAEFGQVNRGEVPYNEVSSIVLGAVVEQKADLPLMADMTCVIMSSERVSSALVPASR